MALSVDALVAICAALNLSPEWLLTGEGPMRRGQIDLAAVPFSELSNEYNTRVQQIARELSEHGKILDGLIGRKGTEHGTAREGDANGA
jgi:hypothetical protein